MKPFVKIWAPFVSLLLAACTAGPDYAPPPMSIPLAYQESADWRPAEPRDDSERGAWWSIYKDPILDDLERQIEISNQNLKAAAAALSEALAVVEETRSALFPTLSLTASVGRQNGTMPTPMSPNTLYGMAAWAPDLWGRLHRSLEGDTAAVEVSAADVAAARLSMQAMVATDYFDLRAQDEAKRLLGAMAAAQQVALRIVQSQYDAGTGSIADVLQAQTQLENVLAQAVHAGVRRAQLDHAIAVLIGKAPADFSLSSQPYADSTPEVPVGLPSTLLERRPDIASAERAVAAANAQIGVETAAWYPNITLSASTGFTGGLIGKLLQASNGFWSVGPALAETVFDAGRRDALIGQRRAAYDASVATYRQTVLTGFQQVEDGLSSLHILAEQERIQTASLAHSRTIEQLMLHHYMSGLEPYSSVLAAQTARLTNEQALLAVRQNRLEASVGLVQALGGGYERPQASAKTNSFGLSSFGGLP